MTYPSGPQTSPPIEPPFPPPFRPTGPLRASGPYDVQPDAGSTDPACDGVTIPPSGQGSGVVYGRPYRSGQVRVELAAR